MEARFPEFVEIYQGYQEGVQRADMFRMAVVLEFGGFYLDLDIECLQSLDPLLDLDCVLSVEKVLSSEQALCLGHRDVVRVANYMFGARPGHSFLRCVLDEMAARSGWRIQIENDVLEATGPGLVTTVYHQEKSRFPEIVLLCSKEESRFGDFAVHKNHGSWRWKRKRRK